MVNETVLVWNRNATDGDDVEFVTRMLRCRRHGLRDCRSWAETPIFDDAPCYAR